MLKAIVIGQLRTLLAGLFGYLATQGYIDGSEQQSLITSVLFVFTCLWSAYDKYRAHQKLVAAQK